MRSLVIGGTLFIGRALAPKLIERGDEVTILHRGRHNPFGKSVREMHCDRNDTDAIRQVMREGRYELVFDNVYDWQRGQRRSKSRRPMMSRSLAKRMRLEPQRP